MGYPWARLISAGPRGELYIVRVTSSCVFLLALYKVIWHVTSYVLDSAGELTAVNAVNKCTRVSLLDGMTVSVCLKAALFRPRPQTVCYEITF